MAKIIPEHKDKLGRTLAVGDSVCYPVSNMLYIGTIIKLNAKMIKVQKISKSNWPAEHNKYPYDVVRLEDSDVTFYVLKNQ